MGCFSWMFANSANKKRLLIGNPGYLLCPDGTVYAEPCYEGYGEFDGHDVYDLVATWNREYLSQHPEYIIFMHGWGRDENGEYGPAPDKRIDQFPWYKYYADLSLSQEEVLEAIKEDDEARRSLGFCEWRSIGITLACYDDQNAALPYPIKICSCAKPRLPYSKLPASEQDSGQGMRGWR